MTVSESYIFKLAPILVKSFREELTREERQILDEWLDAAEKNRRLYLRMREESWLEEKMRGALLIDCEKDYATFVGCRGRLRKLRLRKTIFKYAAIIILFLSVGGGVVWYLKNSGHLLPAVVAKSDLQPEKGGAVLTLAGGEQVLLCETDSLTAKEQSGSLLNITGKMLSYQQITDPLPQTVEYNTLSIPRGGEYYLILADGTKIWLNSESRLRYPVIFGGDKREVYLEGEAFFEVADNKEMPFIVVAGGTATEVLGTEFNLRAYPDEAVVSATLVKGCVRLCDMKKQRQVVLLPGEQGNVVKENGLVSKHEVDIYLYTAWKDGRLVFRNCRMEDLLKVLARWYDVEVFFQNTDVRDIRFTGDICKTEHIDAILEIIEGNGLVSFERHAKTLVVRAK